MPPWFFTLNFLLLITFSNCSLNASSTLSVGSCPDEQLIAAIQTKNIETLNQLLPSCENINKILPSGYALIHYAAEIGSVKIVHNLCLAGANPIIQAQFPDEVIPLLDDSLIQWDGFTPLHFATSKGYLPLVEYLVAGQKVNIDLTDTFNNTPLVYAIEGAHVKIVDYLVKQNANLFVAHSLIELCNAYEISRRASKNHEHSDDAKTITRILYNKIVCLNAETMTSMHDAARKNFKPKRPASPDD